MQYRMDPRCIASFGRMGERNFSPFFVDNSHFFFSLGTRESSFSALRMGVSGRRLVYMYMYVRICVMCVWLAEAYIHTYIDIYTDTDGNAVLRIADAERGSMVKPAVGVLIDVLFSLFFFFFSLFLSPLRAFVHR
jgi:hypothetical protein